MKNSEKRSFIITRSAVLAENAPLIFWWPDSAQIWGKEEEIKGGGNLSLILFLGLKDKSKLQLILVGIQYYFVCSSIPGV